MIKKNPKVIIQLKDVVKAYATGEGHFLTRKDVSFNILQSEFLGIPFNSANLEWRSAWTASPQARSSIRESLCLRTWDLITSWWKPVVIYQLRVNDRRVRLGV